MYYKVYLDSLFMNCLVMDYLLLTLSSRILQRSATRRRRLLASVVGALITTILLICPQLPVALRTLTGYGLSAIAEVCLLYASCRKLRDIAVTTACVYLMSLLYGGFYAALMQSSSYLQTHGMTLPVLLGTGILLYELILLCYSSILRKKAVTDRLYQVQFRLGGHYYRCSALLDTGNQLYEPITGTPVCVVSSEILSEEDRGLVQFLIPYHSLGCKHGMLHGVYAEQVTITAVEGGSCTEQERLLFAISPERLSGNNSYQLLLHSEVMKKSTFND